ncbi:unnamed protein product [Protopolystoma xenopodis]|uniref:Uncharacterized protein n=1 Tax=Protopolystoma xenopodis TaxID=117903 RepID=A0A448XD51_9PLAT|nr:unnamed protein product [Protopolystoma xenopodis]
MAIFFIASQSGTRPSSRRLAQVSKVVQNLPSGTTSSSPSFTHPLSLNAPPLGVSQDSPSSTNCTVTSTSLSLVSATCTACPVGHGPGLFKKPLTWSKYSGGRIQAPRQSGLSSHHLQHLHHNQPHPPAQVQQQSPQALESGKAVSNSDSATLLAGFKTSSTSPLSVTLISAPSGSSQEAPSTCSGLSIPSFSNTTEVSLNSVSRSSFYSTTAASSSLSTSPSSSPSSCNSSLQLPRNSSQTNPINYINHTNFGAHQPSHYIQYHSSHTHYGYTNPHTHQYSLGQYPHSNQFTSQNGSRNYQHQYPHSNPHTYHQQHQFQYGQPHLNSHPHYHSHQNQLKYTASHDGFSHSLLHNAPHSSAYTQGQQLHGLQPAQDSVPNPILPPAATITSSQVVRPLQPTHLRHSVGQQSLIPGSPSVSSQFSQSSTFGSAHLPPPGTETHGQIFYYSEAGLTLPRAYCTPTNEATINTTLDSANLASTTSATSGDVTLLFSTADRVAIQKILSAMPLPQISDVDAHSAFIRLSPPVNLILILPANDLSDLAATTSDSFTNRQTIDPRLDMHHLYVDHSALLKQSPVISEVTKNDSPGTSEFLQEDIKENEARDKKKSKRERKDKQRTKKEMENSMRAAEEGKNSKIVSASSLVDTSEASANLQKKKWKRRPALNRSETDEENSEENGQFSSKGRACNVVEPHVSDVMSNNSLTPGSTPTHWSTNTPPVSGICDFHEPVISMRPEKITKKKEQDLREEQEEGVPLENEGKDLSVTFGSEGDMDISSCYKPDKINVSGSPASGSRSKRDVLGTGWRSDSSNPTRRRLWQTQPAIQTENQFTKKLNDSTTQEVQQRALDPDDIRFELYLAERDKEARFTRVFE